VVVIRGVVVLAMSLNPRPAVPAVPRRASGPSGLALIGRDHPQRAAVQAFVRGIYAQRYGADVPHFAPWLVALHDHDGEIVAAAGYRAAGAEPLFLERYLAAPVDALLGAEMPQPLARERIVEVGHLAASRAGEGRRLIALLGPHLAAQGFQWVVSTLTEELRHLFVRLGIAPLALGVADPEVLGAEAVHWGSYYDHRPLVLAGQLDVALQALARRRVPS